MGILYFFLFLIVAAILIMPFIILDRQKSHKADLDRLSDDVNELDNKLLFILKHMATKYDLNQMQKNISKDDIVHEPENIQPQEEAPIPQEETATPPPIVEPQPIIVSPIVEEKVQQEPIVETPVTTEVPVQEIVAAEESVPNQSEVESASVEPAKAEDLTEKIVEEPIKETYAVSELAKHEPIVVSEPVEPIVQHPMAQQATQVFAQQTAQQDIPPADRYPYPYQVVEDEEDADKSLIERIFGGNLLAKIGIVTLVLGIGFFVKYAIDQGWINEVARVGIGLAVGGAIIGIAHKLKEKYNVFSSILVGGGISVFYVTITLAFREYEIFSQPVAFTLLIIVTIFSVILSLLYNRQELAIFSLIGGVLAPFMVSTGSGNYIVLFSYMLILNTGMLVISLKKNWKIINIIAYIASLLFFWTWLIVKFEVEYMGASIFAVLFFAQFYTLAIIKHLREGNKMSIFQAILILTNNLSVFLALMFILNDYTPDLRGVVTLVLAAVNAVVMMTLFRQTKVDRNMIYLIIAVVMSFVSLAIPIQLQGYVITMFWAAETVLLLWLWQRSRINIFYVGFLVISLLSLISYGMDLSDGYTYYFGGEALSMFSNKMFITGVVMVLSFGASLLLLSKEEDDEFARHKNIAIFFRFMFVMLLFIVPYLEISYQLDMRVDVEYSESFRYLVLATYTTIFVSGLALTYRRRVTGLGYGFLLLGVLLYAVVYLLLAIDLREDIYRIEIYPVSYFLVHLLSIPAIASIIYVLAKNTKRITLGVISLFSWILVILSTIILSVELDNLVIMLLGNVDNYYSLLDDSRTFGYPILWGLIAMVLMLWGLKHKEVVLRKISLISFGLIVIKFYAYDVWQMSQVGKIVSFVILGIILLVVSFMQQKIKVLVQKDETLEEEIVEEEKEIQE